jgi:integrase
MASLRRFPRTRFWFACFQGPHGERLQRSTKQTDRRKAQKVADQYEHAAREARAGALTERQARKVISEIYSLATKQQLRGDSIHEFFTQWPERVRVESGHKTIIRYQGVVRRFLAFLGHRATLSIAHLSSVDITRFRDHLAKLHSPASVNLSLAAIQSGLSRAFDDRLVDTNECARVRRLADDQSRSQQRRAFTEDELKKILAACDIEWRGMVLTSLYTGARLGDVSLLRFENIDFSSRELIFKSEKTGRQQAVPIAAPLFKHLSSLAPNGSRDPLFPRAFATRQRGVPTGSLSNQFRRILERADIVEHRDNHTVLSKGRDARRESAGLGFHCLRHTATSLLKSVGTSDVVAREIIGHDSTAVSRIYTHIGTDVLRRAVDQLPDITKDLLTVESD